MEKFDTYSVGGFSINGRTIGKEGFLCEDMAIKEAQEMAQESFCASVSVWGWKNGEPTELRIIK